jgi:hypothetical protein
VRNIESCQTAWFRELPPPTLHKHADTDRVPKGAVCSVICRNDPTPYVTKRCEPSCVPIGRNFQTLDWPRLCPCFVTKNKVVAAGMPSFLWYDLLRSWSLLDMRKNQKLIKLLYYYSYEIKPNDGVQGSAQIWEFEASMLGRKTGANKVYRFGYVGMVPPNDGFGTGCQRARVEPKL